MENTWKKKQFHVETSKGKKNGDVNSEVGLLSLQDELDELLSGPRNGK